MYAAIGIIRKDGAIGGKSSITPIRKHHADSIAGRKGPITPALELHDYATNLYSHATMTAVEPIRAAPVSVRLPRSERGVDPAGGPRRIRVGIIGATGYVGGELVRLLARHPNVELVGLVGRGRDHDPIAGTHAHLATLDLDIHAELPPADAVFLALPHGAAAEIVPDLISGGHRDHRPGPRLPTIRAGGHSPAPRRASGSGCQRAQASSGRDRMRAARPTSAAPSRTEATTAMAWLVVRHWYVPEDARGERKPAAVYSSRATGTHTGVARRLQSHGHQQRSEEQAERGDVDQRPPGALRRGRQQRQRPVRVELRSRCLDEDDEPSGGHQD